MFGVTPMYLGFVCCVIIKAVGLRFIDVSRSGVSGWVGVCSVECFTKMLAQYVFLLSCGFVGSGVGCMLVGRGIKAGRPSRWTVSFILDFSSVP